MTVDAGTWSLGDTEIIARAVVEAPSVHDTQPWNLRLPDHSAELEERLEFAEPGPDPLRVDRLISCGTALANLELAIRVLGNRSRTSVLPDPQRPELIARIETLGSGTPSSRDLRLYAAISHRRSHRESFTDIPVPTETLADVVAAAGEIPDVDVRLLAADEAVADAKSIEHVLVVARTGIDVEWTEGRDLWWHETVEKASPEHEAQPFDSEHPLFILYTSGTTGKPKGIIHSSGGYLTQASYTHHYVFDHKPGKDVYWCTADIGWVTGHSYIVYGPLSNGVTQVVYEGTPNSPNEHRHFEIIEKYGVSIYYTAPTLIRTFMKWGREIPDAHDLSSIRLLGSVGEPINPEAWRWYREVIGADSAPIVDTWWQTETGAIMISPLPGITATKPGSAMAPLPGISAKIVDDEATPLGAGGNGYLVLDQPWPAMLRGIWGDEQRYRETYWSRYAEQGWYFAGDGARYDDDGALWVLGRVDDVMNVSGHRISTSEVESALVSHPSIAEAAVVGAADETTGQGIVAFVILREHVENTGDTLIKELRDHVAVEISPIAKPRQITVVPELPKTRSGKIMRRLLRDVAEGRELGDTSTLVDPAVFDAIRGK